MSNFLFTQMAARYAIVNCGNGPLYEHIYCIEEGLCSYKTQSYTATVKMLSDSPHSCTTAVILGFIKHRPQ